MFSDGFEENESSKVVIKDIEPESMRIVLDYVYSGGKEIKIEEDNVQSLLQASNLLQFGDIKLLCAEFLLKHLETTNCLQFLEMAESQWTSLLENISLKFQNFMLLLEVKK